MDKILNVYHGSVDIINKPVYGKGKTYNDYGLGFYCTENIELAKEWASATAEGGFANNYSLNTKGLKILDLTNSNILIWLAILIENRTFKINSGIAVEAKEYLHNEFLLDISSYDVICGYRADDSYFAFADAFLNGTLSLNQLSKAMRLGELGEQTVLKSEKAFNNLTFLGSEKTEKEHFNKRETRDAKARKEFKVSNSVYILDILRGEWKKDDPRL